MRRNVKWRETLTKYVKPTFSVFVACLLTNKNHEITLTLTAKVEYLFISPYLKEMGFKPRIRLFKQFCSCFSIHEE